MTSDKLEERRKRRLSARHECRGARRRVIWLWLLDFTGTATARGGSASAWAPPITADPATGQKRRRPVVKWFVIQADSRKEAEAKQAEILDKLAKGTYVEPSKLTLAEFLEQHFIPHLVAKGRSLATVESYRRNIKEHIIPHLGHLRLDQLAPLHIEQWINCHHVAHRQKPPGTPA